MITSSFRIVTEIKCNCCVYPYPHAVGRGLCCQKVVSEPFLRSPKKGLAGKLINLLHQYESVENHELSSLIADIKELLNAPR